MDRPKKTVSVLLHVPVCTDIPDEKAVELLDEGLRVVGWQGVEVLLVKEHGE